jgi:TrmH family RNA methyltransferase
MISKTRIRFITSLQNKKTRDEERLFVIEGDKIVREFLSAGIHLKLLIAKTEFINSVPGSLMKSVDAAEHVSFEDLKLISTLKTPHNALAVVYMPEQKINITTIMDHYCAALDMIQDPGNMGTIIRAAGWFGIKNIVCSQNCVDVYNPKVIQASMGAILHVTVSYCDLRDFLAGAQSNNVPVFGTMLDGKSIYDHIPGNKGIILFGNESKGISEDLIPFITEKISIPKFSIAKEGIDSLNVGMAASVVFSEFRRKSHHT